VKLAIIGAGIAGTAAAFEMARLGGRAKVIHGLTGVSGLYSGALDDEPWDLADPTCALEDGVNEFSTQLGAWQLSPRHVATLEGNVRPARGSDRALLDLERCAGKRVAVVELERDDWDAPLLANSFASSAWARHTGTQFFAVPLPLLAQGFERRISGYDFASLHDAPERAQALRAALRESQVSADAWLFGPWLGIERPLAEELGGALSVPVGETTSAPGGAAGARFERARDRLLTRVADVERGHLTSLERASSGAGGGYILQLRDRPPEQFTSVVLATGGVAAGGVALERSFERRGGTGFRLSFSAPLALTLDSEVVEGVSSLARIDFTERGLGALLEVGIATRSDGSVPENPGLFVAGDAAFGRPRTALIAADSGLKAARAALDYVRRLS
jgi:glycerol-3-phosphate dehydrogenase subunit B